MGGYQGTLPLGICENVLVRSSSYYGLARLLYGDLVTSTLKNTMLSSRRRVRAGMEWISSRVY